VTAKGESVANLADVLGTIFGILLSKARPPVLPTYCLLSAGYLISSRKEVDAVELPYLNRARLAYSMAQYLQTGGCQQPLGAGGGRGGVLGAGASLGPGGREQQGAAGGCGTRCGRWAAGLQDRGPRP
jgi:hypothetical protein